MLVRTQDRSLVTKPAACRRTIEARSPSRWRSTSGLLRGALTLANRPTSSELELERVAERRPDLRCAYSFIERERAASSGRLHHASRGLHRGQRLTGGPAQHQDRATVSRLPDHGGAFPLGARERASTGSRGDRCRRVIVRVVEIPADGMHTLVLVAAGGHAEFAKTSADVRLDGTTCQVQ